MYDSASVSQDLKLSDFQLLVAAEFLLNRHNPVLDLQRTYWHGSAALARITSYNEPF